MEMYKINFTCVEKGTMDCHIKYFSLFLHWQDFWIPNFTPTNNTPEIAKMYPFAFNLENFALDRFIFYMDVVCDARYKYEVCEL